MAGDDMNGPSPTFGTEALLTRYRQVQGSLSSLTAALILVMSVLLVANILIRFSDVSAIWVPSLAQLLIIYVVFLPLGFLELEQRHIKVNYFYNKAPTSVQRALDYGSRVLGLVVVVLMFVSSVEALQQFGGRTSAVGIPSAMVFIPAVVGMGLLGIEYVRRLVNLLRDDLW